MERKWASLFILTCYWVNLGERFALLEASAFVRHASFTTKVLEINFVNISPVKVLLSDRGFLGQLYLDLRRFSLLIIGM